ncbi:MAG: Rrf2 family transcriptional regulator [Candidatus Eisenbacteria bacterium]|nr:Rrf2 family transcriptional regulator [Candidatus Eisenbacteria bacterium]
MRCMVQLARHDSDEPLTIAEISRREGLSLPYVGKLMNLLRQAGLAESVRGRSGGYVLPRPADQITLDTIVGALGGKLFEQGYCDRHPAGEETCVHAGDCSIRSVWAALHRLMGEMLSRTSLADLMRSEEEVVDVMGSQPTPDWPFGKQGARTEVTIGREQETGRF